MTKADRHVIGADIEPGDTIEWLRGHGYLGAAVGGVGRGVALVFGRPGEPAVIAGIGNTLVFWKHLNSVEVEA